MFSASAWLNIRKLIQPTCRKKSFCSSFQFRVITMLLNASFSRGISPAGRGSVQATLTLSVGTGRCSCSGRLFQTTGATTWKLCLLSFVAFLDVARFSRFAELKPSQPISPSVVSTRVITASWVNCSWLGGRKGIRPVKN